MEQTSTPVMPTETTDDSKQGKADDVVSCVIGKIEDDIIDARSLREWRPGLAVGLLVVAFIFYGLFCLLLYVATTNSDVAYNVSNAQTFYIVVAILLALIPTLLVISVSKAVFGKKESNQQTPFTPLEAILHLMREMRS